MMKKFLLFIKVLVVSLILAEQAVAITFVKPYEWSKEKTLKYGFYPSVSSENLRKFKEVANFLNRAIGGQKLRFVLDVQDADIRVSQDQAYEQSSYTSLGKNLESVNRGTYNFHLLSHGDKEKVSYHTILHELLHAMSFGHEHNSPQSQFYRYHAPQLYTDQEIAKEIGFDDFFELDKTYAKQAFLYKSSELVYGFYDPFSVMNYNESSLVFPFYLPFSTFPSIFHSFPLIPL